MNFSLQIEAPQPFPAGSFNPLSYPAGIFKYRNLEDADRQKNEWDIENALKKLGRDRERHS
jgi:hypothetical protein